MKCPKCGYNSFEYLDNCKKCNVDLSSHKMSLGIRSIILPAARVSQPAAEPAVAASPAQAMEPADDGFSWESDTPAFGQNEPASAPASVDFAADTAGKGAAQEDAFSFAEPAPAAPVTATPTETFGEFSFEDLATDKEPTTSAAPASNWSGGSEFSAESFPGFADEPAKPAAAAAKKEEPHSGKQQASPTEGLFNSADFADLFKDDDTIK